MKAKKIIAVILTLAMVFSLAACGGSGGSSGGDAAPSGEASGEDGGICTVVPESDILVLKEGDGNTFFPADMQMNLEFGAADLVYQSLCAFDQDQNIVWVLASGCDVSEDGKEYTFHLRPGIKFTGGDDWNAEAAKKNFDELLDPAAGHGLAWLFDPIETTEVVDEYEFKIILKDPYAPLLMVLATFPGFVSPTLLDKGSEAWSREVDGTGQYALTEYASGEYAKYTLKRDYWGYDPELCGGTALIEPDVGFNTVTIKFIAEESTRIAMLINGEAQAISSFTKKNAPMLEEAGNTVLQVNGGMISYLYFNMDKEPLNDVRVRKAIAMAIDTAQLNETVYDGMYGTAESLLPPACTFFKSQGVIPYDVEAAKKLLEEAGYPGGGFTLQAWEWNDTSDIQRGQFIQQQLAQIGITVELTPMEGATVESKIYEYSGEDGTGEGYDIFIEGYSTDTFDADQMLGRFVKDQWPGAGSNYSFWTNEEYEQLAVDGRKELDTEKRAEIYERMQEIIWEELPSDPLLVAGWLAAYGPKIAHMELAKDMNIDWTTAKYAAE